MTGPAWSQLVSLVVNLHAGQAARRRGRLGRQRSALAQLVRTHNPDVVYLLEVRSMRAVRRATRGYWRAPLQLTGHEGVVVLLRKKTFPHPGPSWNRRITAARDTMHPERRLVAATATHAPSGRDLLALGVHLWALGDGWRSPEAVVNKHVAQTLQFAAEASAAIEYDPNVLVFAGGDWNEDLDSSSTHGGRTAVAIMRKHGGLIFAHRNANQHASTSTKGRSLLDDVAYRATGFCELVTRRTIPIPDPRADHRAVLTHHRIRS